MITIFEALAATYLAVVALVIRTDDLPSALVFKVLPALIGFPLVFMVVAKLMNWPV